MLAKTLKNTFGLACNIEETRLKGLPLYLVSGRKTYRVSLGEIVFLLVELSEKDQFGAVALKKQIPQYSEKVDMNVAFCFDKLTRVQRDALIAKEIPFIALPDQIYLPFLGVLLNNNFKKKAEVSGEKMMPATQSLFLYLLYRGEQTPVIKKQAAEVLGLTRTSITRASEQLKKMGLISEQKVGKESQMVTVENGLTLFRLAKDYLINPIQKTVGVQGNNLKQGILAGESALSRHSMLGKPKTDVYAIYKANEQSLSLREIDTKWQSEESIILVEFWKYDPALFSKDGTVDPVSLAMSLSENDDERVQGELEVYLEGYQW